MAGKCRPSLRPKTIENVMRSSLSTTDKNCIKAMFERVELLENEIKAILEDAVKIVRCEDCRHTREPNENEKEYLTDGVLICTSYDATDDCWNPVWPDHFCSYGKRRAE